MGTSKPLGYMLDRSLRVFRNQMIFEFRERGIDLTIEQFVILHFLNSNCDLIQRDLANYLQKDKSIIVRQINCLLMHQYVAGSTNSEDKRKKNLVLTKKGFEILDKMREISGEVSGKLLTDVSEYDLGIFHNVLKKIQQNGGAAEDEEERSDCRLNQQKQKTDIKS
jgi:DNA-binding MarR family transcriptional regulator